MTTLLGDGGQLPVHVADMMTFKDYLKNGKAIMFNVTGKNNDIPLVSNPDELSGEYECWVKANNNFSLYRQGEGIVAEGSLCNQFSLQWREIDELKGREEGERFAFVATF